MASETFLYAQAVEWFLGRYLPAPGSYRSSVHYTITDTSDASGGNLSILGDVASDHFSTSGDNGASYTGVYLAKASDGSGIIAERFSASGADLGSYSYSNDPTPTYSLGRFSGDPFTIVCYVAGTRILTEQGAAAIEDLAIGDVLVTASGERRPVKWIGHRAYAGRFAERNPDLMPVRFKAGSLTENVPTRDLLVSPKHAMLIDGVLIPAERLVNGVSIVKETSVGDEIAYYHVELESHDALIAEGAASESFVEDGGRGIFHNAADYEALYPHESKREPVYCAPRVEDGYIVDAVRHRLADRAGLPSLTAVAFGDLSGSLDTFHAGGHVRGWARDAAFPDASVCLDLILDGQLVGRVLADQFRPDLQVAGVGDGRHAFETRLALDPSGARLEVRCSGDGALVGVKVLAPSEAAA